METAIKVLQSHLESLRSMVKLGKSVYPLVENYKLEIPEIESAIDKLKQ